MAFADKSLPEIIIIVILVGLVIMFVSEGPTDPNQAKTPLNAKSISIASWNLQIFGISKWSDESTEIMRVIKPYDIIVIQEIRDESGSAWNSLCNNLSNDYNCFISSRAGRSISKEQYGIIYRKWITLTNTKDFNSDSTNNAYWERPPLEAEFQVGNFSFIAYTIHTRPEDAATEIDNLYQYADYSKNNSVIVLGDLNADCAYYDERGKTSFANWYWIITDSADTTTGDNNCTYDRIIINQLMHQSYFNYGIATSFNSSLSDHYLVWAEFNI
jgi:deoxyribonuclease-1-like protein